LHQAVDGPFPRHPTDERIERIVRDPFHAVVIGMATREQQSKMPYPAGKRA